MWKARTGPVGMKSNGRLCGTLSANEVGRFGAGDSVYSHEVMKTIKPPGMMSGAIVVPNRMGEMYKRIPVATAVARHLMTALASIPVS